MPQKNRLHYLPLACFETPDAWHDFNFWLIFNFLNKMTAPDNRALKADRLRFHIGASAADN
ncbi:MAG: hypothetical protein CM15mP95_2890 [Alphaproteobacteria bacterium]|nr:MAG: hypothetical protein CM15mP95_2890 [Alphaproteobacteria bacterium]